jgi:hypothetical protein
LGKTKAALDARLGGCRDLVTAFSFLASGYQLLILLDEFGTLMLSFDYRLELTAKFRPL